MKKKLQEPSFKIGDTVWYAKCDHTTVTKPCPVCFGNKEVTLILGNGESVILKCDYCGKGWESPRGVVDEPGYVIAPECVTIKEIHIIMTETGNKYEYQSGCHAYYSDRLFASKEDAIAKGIELKTDLDTEQTTKSEYLKKDVKKSFAWNAGYHMRAAKEHHQKAAYHERNARLCKEKIKETNE